MGWILLGAFLNIMNTAKVYFKRSRFMPEHPIQGLIGAAALGAVFFGIPLWIFFGLILGI